MQKLSIKAFLVICLVSAASDKSIDAQTDSDSNLQPYVTNFEAKNNTAYWSSTTQANDARLQDPVPDDRLNSLNNSNDLESLVGDSTESTSDTLSNWPNKTLSEIRVSPFSTSGEIPADRSGQLLSSYIRDWRFPVHSEKILNWCAPHIKYKPLFFEDVALERYGNVCRNDCYQTVISAAHFFSSASLWPLHALHDPAFSCDYPLGYCRPGNCTDRIFQRQFWGR